VTEDDIARIEQVRVAKETADADWQTAVLALAERSSIREAAKVAGISPDTIVRWRRQSK
jgi:transposase-like protein